MRGRKPKPTALKRLEGNRGKRPLPENEAAPLVEIPSCPQWLPGIGKQEWRRLCPLLAELGLLSKVDRGSLAMCCLAYSMVHKAQRDIAKNDITGITDKGYEYQRPTVGILSRYMELYKQYMSEFGLSPAARTRIKVEKKEDGPTGLAGFAARKVEGLKRVK